MTKRYGRARRGRRIAEATPEGNWKIHTILGAMSVRGMIATMTIEAATDAEIFLAYLDHMLCPALRAGDVVVMDNPQLAQSCRGSRANREDRRGVTLSAALLARPQPHREGLGQTQTATPRSQGKNRNRTRPSDYRTTPNHPTSRRNCLVQTAICCSTTIANQL